MRSRIPEAILGAIGAVAVARISSRKLSVVNWERKHHDGTSVSLFGGLEVAAGVLGTGLALINTKIGQAGLVAGISGALAGWVDDHLENKFAAVGKGFKGHLGALRNGRITSGMLKIIVIGCGATASAIILEANERVFPQSESAQPGRFSKISHIFYDAGLNTVIIAGSANILNLLDLRPGRALKFGTFACLPGLLQSNKVLQALSVGIITTGFVSLPEDLSGKKMLGDLGANAYGGLIGVLLAKLAGERSIAKPVLAAVVVGLTLASEKVSFSQVIENTPVLNKIDQLGR